MFPTLPNRTDCFCGSGSRIGMHITLYKPPSPVICHSFHISKMTGTHQEQLIDHLVFIEFDFLLYLIFSRHRRQQNPAPAQPPSPSPPPPPPRKRRNPWVLPWILQREERGCYRTLLGELITTDIPGDRNFTRMEPAFFYLIEGRITPSSLCPSPPALSSLSHPSPLSPSSFSLYPQLYLLTQTVVECLQLVLKSFSFCPLA